MVMLPPDVLASDVAAHVSHANAAAAGRAVDVTGDGLDLEAAPGRVHADHAVHP